MQIGIGDLDPLQDPDFIETIVQIREALAITTGSEQEIVLYLTFSPNSNPVYRVFPNAKRPTGSDGVAYSRLERKLFDFVLGKFSIHYIPSEKSVGDLYRSLVMPHLFKKMHKSLGPHLRALDTALIESATEINDFLSGAGLGGYRTSFELPRRAEEFFSTVEFNLRDANTTSIFQKGMGIQSAVLLASFCWMARQEKSEGKLPLWLLEEPESYLHPELASQCLLLLNELSKEAQVVITTHSLGFVPQDPEKVIGVELNSGWTETSKFRTYHDATKKIRTSLGVKFSDYYNLSEHNLFVEGQTDRKYIDFVLDCIRPVAEVCVHYPVLLSANTSIHDFGGVKGLEGFLRATYEFIRVERATVSVFDGDDAGDRSRRDLQQFFGRKEIPFAANSEFVIVRDRFAIEGLLPDAWIKDLQAVHGGWFEGYAEDAEGRILPFKVKDSSKEQYFNAFREKVKASEFNDWFARWRPVLDVCETTLRRQSERLRHLRR